MNIQNFLNNYSVSFLKTINKIYDKIYIVNCLYKEGEINTKLPCCHLIRETQAKIMDNDKYYFNPNTISYGCKRIEYFYEIPFDGDTDDIDKETITVNYELKSSKPNYTLIRYLKIENIKINISDLKSYLKNKGVKVRQLYNYDDLDIDEYYDLLEN